MEARSRKYHTMRNGFLMACLLAAITAGGEVRLDKVWEYSENNSMKPAWMGANTERSMAYHDGSLYVISRNGGNKLLQLSSDGILQKATASLRRLHDFRQRLHGNLRHERAIGFQSSRIVRTRPARMDSRCFLFPTRHLRLPRHNG